MSNMVQMLFINFCGSHKYQFNGYLNAYVVGQPKLLPVVSFHSPIKLSLLERVVSKTAVVCCFHHWGNLIKKCVRSSKTLVKGECRLCMHFEVKWNVCINVFSWVVELRSENGID